LGAKSRNKSIPRTTTPCFGTRGSQVQILPLRPNKIRDLADVFAISLRVPPQLPHQHLQMHGQLPVHGLVVSIKGRSAAGSSASVRRRSRRTRSNQLAQQEATRAGQSLEAGQ
jgi:hypothetical protein